jgi:hypothetical protein
VRITVSQNNQNFAPRYYTLPADTLCVPVEIVDERAKTLVIIVDSESPAEVWILGDAPAGENAPINTSWAAPIPVGNAFRVAIEDPTGFRQTQFYIASKGGDGALVALSGEPWLLGT